MIAAMFVLAHLSDPHLAPLPRPRLSELRLKRGLGWLNWLRSRRAIHRRDTLDMIMRDLAGARADHIAVTGDLVNIALAAEFAKARDWLDRIGPAADVSVVPGNHDAYVAGAPAEFARRWAPYMAADGQNSSGLGPFPYVRRRGPVALVGLSSGVPTGPLLATGRLGAAQIDRMAAILSELRAAPVFRIVMIHHPPHIPPTSRFKRLVDAAAFRDAIASVGAELIIHGHDHVHSLAWIAGRDAQVPVVGVPSASAALGSGREPAAYNLYRIDEKAGGWTCEVTSRGLDGRGVIGELRRFELSGDRRD